MYRAQRERHWDEFLQSNARPGRCELLWTGIVAAPIPRRHIAIGLPHYSLFSIRLIRITVPMPTFTNLAVLCTLIFPARARLLPSPSPD